MKRRSSARTGLSDRCSRPGTSTASARTRVEVQHLAWRKELVHRDVGRAIEKELLQSSNFLPADQVWPRASPDRAYQRLSPT